jgi:hypothetical protein
VLVDDQLAAVHHRPSPRAAPTRCWYFEVGFGLLDSRRELLANPEEAAASIDLSLL